MRLEANSWSRRRTATGREGRARGIRYRRGSGRRRHLERSIERYGGCAGCIGARTAGVLPLGTINVFARELNLPTTLPEAWQILETGREQLIDLPVAEFTLHGSPVRRVFGQLAGAGFDSRAVELVNWEHKKRFGGLAYLLAGVQAMGEVRSQIVVTAAGQTCGGEMVLIGNGRFYGGSHRVFPLADLTDGVLEVVVFPRINWPVLMRSGWALWRDDFARSADAIHLRGASVELQCPGRASFQLDGEQVGQLPATIKMHPERLRVLVP